ncbi:MAG: 50S ribosomal protein L33 [Patescibacteria group bacterium]
MSQDRLAKLKNKKTGSIIITTRNKKTNPKIKLKKFDPKTRKPGLFEEIKW